MNIVRNFLEGGAGGLLGGGLFGLAEAIFHLTTSGAPDLLSPVYAVVLYGLIGIPFGLGAAVVTSVIEKMWKKQTDGAAFAFGMAGAITPLGLFVLRYLANKVVYAEQGVPMTGNLAILAIVLVVDLLLLTLGARVLGAGLKYLLRAPGVLKTYGALVAVTAVVAFIPVGDNPRKTWEHGKVVPDGMGDKPNVMLIMVDTLRADYLGTYGYEGDPTPVIDALGDDGIVFEQHVAQASWTRSSGASLMTSRLPSGHNADKKASRLPQEVTTYAEALQPAGVATGALINNINLTSTFGFDQGWDTFIYESPDYSFGATESVFSLTMYKVVHKLNEKIFGAHKQVSSFYQPADVVLEDAKGFISANKDSRWSLFVHLMEPHDPYFEHPHIMETGDAEYNGVGFARAEVEHPEDTPENITYLEGVYRDEVIYLDQKLEPFIAWLEEEGVYDDTLILLTADHGEEFGEHGGFWHGTTLYDEQIHVPLIVKLPGGELAGTRVPWQSRAIDVAPTITAAMGIETNPEWSWEGSDLLQDVRAWRMEGDVWVERLRSGEPVDDLLKQLPKDTAVIAVDVGTELPAGSRVTAELDNPEAAIEDAVVIDSMSGVTRLLVPEEHGLEEEPGVDVAIAAQIAPSDTDPEASDVSPCEAWASDFSRPAVSEEDFEGNVIASIRKEGAKWISAEPGGPRGLPAAAFYDLARDPGETKNLAEEGAPICGQYVEDLDEEMRLAIKSSAQNATSGGDACISEAEYQKLVALGYMEADADFNKCE